MGRGFDSNHYGKEGRGFVLNLIALEERVGDITQFAYSTVILERNTRVERKNKSIISNNSQQLTKKGMAPIWRTIYRDILSKKLLILKIGIN